MGVLCTFNGFGYWFRKEPEFGVYQPVIAVMFFIIAARSIHIAYVGRVPIMKGTGDETMTVGNNDSQPESDEVATAGEYKDNDTTTQ